MINIKYLSLLYICARNLVQHQFESVVVHGERIAEV